MISFFYKIYRGIYSINLYSKKSMCILNDSEFLSGLGTAFFSVRYVPFFSILFKERSVLFHSFFGFLATYETQKNVKECNIFLQKM